LWTVTRQRYACDGGNADAATAAAAAAAVARSAAAAAADDENNANAAATAAAAAAAAAAVAAAMVTAGETSGVSALLRRSVAAWKGKFVRVRVCLLCVCLFIFACLFVSLGYLGCRALLRCSVDARKGVWCLFVCGREKLVRFFVHFVFHLSARTHVL
jgi:hypothetical protein